MKPEDIERVKELLPTSLGSEEIREQYAREILQRSVFSARKEYARYLAKIREVATELSAGRINATKAREALLNVLSQIGYDTTEDDGKVSNPVSQRRLDLILETQRQMAASVARISLETDDTLDMYPAWELTRADAPAKPREDWPARWNAAGASVNWEGARKGIYYGSGVGIGFVALKSSPIWAALGSGVGGYRDTLGNPYPPFAYGSYMDWVDVDRETAQQLGLIRPDETASVPSAPSLSPDDAELLEAAKRVGWPARVVVRPTESPLTAGVVQARLSLKSLAHGALNTNLREFNESTRIFLRPTESLLSLYLLDLGVKPQKAHARKTRPFQSPRRYALRLRNLAVLQRPLGCFQPSVENMRLNGIATIFNLIAVIDQLRGWRQRLANGDDIAKATTLQRLGVARRLCADVVKIGLNVQTNVVFTDLIPALHGILPPEERLNPPRMAVRYTTREWWAPYGTGSDFYSLVTQAPTRVSYLHNCRNNEMIPQTAAVWQAAHGTDFRMSALLLRCGGSIGLFKGKLELLVLLPYIAGVEIAASRERVVTDQPSDEKRHGDSVKLDDELAETFKEFIHTEIITRNAA